MTIDQIMMILSEQKRILGGDAVVAIEWDYALHGMKFYGIQNGMLIFDGAGLGYNDSELCKKFDCESMQWVE